MHGVKQLQRLADRGHVVHADHLDTLRRCAQATPMVPAVRSVVASCSN